MTRVAGHSTASSGEYVTVRRSDRPALGSWDGDTYTDRAEGELFRLCAALGYEHEYERYLGVLRDLLAGWGNTLVPRNPPYPSVIGDDHSPYEFSLQFEPGSVELRLLVEAQGTEPSARSNLQAALELNRHLAERYSLDLTRFSKVAGLFLPDEPPAPFSLWHAVCWAPGMPPSFKVYLNPHARGKERARDLIDETIARLGLSEETRSYLDRVAGAPTDELRYFSLDLDSGPKSRVKVYVTHHGAGAKELEQVMSVSPHHQAGDVPAFCEAMVGHQGPFTLKPVTTCVSFIQGSPEPYATTLHLPIAHYVDSDQATAGRAAHFLRENGLDHLRYQRSINVFAPRGLDEGVGVQSYASYRREAAGLHFSAYLSPELFRSVASDDTQLRQVVDDRSGANQLGALATAKR